MKKDRLVEFVIHHATEFDSLEPPRHAWDRIETALPKSEQVARRRLWSYAWKSAAAVLIFASAWLLHDYSDYKKHTNASLNSRPESNSPELNELSDAEAYYTSQISSKQLELATYARQHPEIIDDLKKEFVEMDKNKEELKKDLAESNADEKVIEAIIMSYRFKLEILEQMLTELRKTQNDGKRQTKVETKL